MSFEGAVPPLYREVYDILCPQQEQIDQDLFVHLLLKSSLPRTTVSQVYILAFVSLYLFHNFSFHFMFCNHVCKVSSGGRILYKYGQFCRKFARVIYT